MSLPHYLGHKDILAGMAYLDGHPPPKGRSIKKCVRWKGKEYPPKQLIRDSHRSFDGTEFQGRFRGGAEANNFLINREFPVWNKNTGEGVSLEPVLEDDSQQFDEGKAAYALHRRLERDSRIAKIAKRLRLRAAHDLKCDVCDFSSERVYGSLGTGYIEAHHTIPISEMARRKKTKTHPSDMALVCSNCHRMLHRRRPWLGISELRDLLRIQETKA
jgi:ribosomal protein L44E